MNRTTLAAIAAAVLLLLTGCTATNQATTEPLASSTTPSTSATTESAAPLVASSPTAAPDGGEAAFLDEVRAKLRPNNVIPDATDEQLLKAGREACERRAAGEPSESISVIDGEPQSGLGLYVDSGVIVTVARSTICPS